MTRAEAFSQKRTLPVRWFDLVTFDPEWLKDKTVTTILDADDVYKPRVCDALGKQVYPCE